MIRYAEGGTRIRVYGGGGYDTTNVVPSGSQRSGRREAPRPARAWPAERHLGKAGASDLLQAAGDGPGRSILRLSFPEPTMDFLDALPGTASFDPSNGIFEWALPHRPAAEGIFLYPSLWMTEIHLSRKT